MKYCDTNCAAPECGLKNVSSRPDFQYNSSHTLHKHELSVQYVLTYVVLAVTSDQTLSHILNTRMVCLWCVLKSVSSSLHFL